MEKDNKGGKKDKVILKGIAGLVNFKCEFEVREKISKNGNSYRVLIGKLEYADFVTFVPSDIEILPGQFTGTIYFNPKIENNSLTLKLVGVEHEPGNAQTVS